MHLILLIATLLFCIPAQAGSEVESEKASPRFQYVLISFDGAHALSQWDRSRSLARKTGARFTYFVSCTFLLSTELRRSYSGPGMETGKSNVGFAASREEVADRLQHIWAARREGNEIASHGCGHFDGKQWNAGEWKEEFTAFEFVLENAWSLNRIPFEPEGWKNFVKNEIRGFRAPYLSTSPSLFRALRASGFAYDASAVSKGPATPVADDRLYRFALPLIPEGPKGKPVIAMDYNFFVRHSAGLESPGRATEFSDRAYRALTGAFEREYKGRRIPLQFGFHFSLMNGGAYWNALERFAEETCGRPEVRCVTYRDYLLEAAAPALDG